MLNALTIGKWFESGLLNGMFDPPALVVHGKRPMILAGARPEWLTFDCYGTLIQWDEGLAAALHQILTNKGANLDIHQFIRVYDRYEHDLEQETPHRSFKAVTEQHWDWR